MHMKLIDVIAELDDYSQGAAILAEVPWSDTSRAAVEFVETNDFTKFEKNGMTFFMLVVMAAISRSEFLRNGLQQGDHRALCAALIDRAYHRSTPFDKPSRTPQNLPQQNASDEDATIAFDPRMTYLEFAALPDRLRGKAFQSLNPYDHPPLFAAVRRAFLEAHPNCARPHEVVVGLGPGLGPYNSVGVRVAPGQKLRVPRSFMGIPVDKLVHSKSGWRRAR